VSDGRSAQEALDLIDDLPRVRVLTAKDVEGLVEELAAYHAEFAPLFKRSEQRASAEVYLRGLLTAEVPRKNVEAMVLRLSGAGEDADRKVRAVQQFVGEGAWDDQAILAKHQRLVDESLGEDDGVLIIDGSDFPKQGKHSAGVARQWCGASGKKDNCQAGVFLGYASRKGYTLLDRRLYLPESWFGEDHRELRQRTRIPEETKFQTKHELAGELVEKVVRERHVRARWVVCDEGYGDDFGLLDRWAGLGLWYLAEVPSDTKVWALVEPDGQVRARPTTWVKPQTPSRKGRVPTRERVHPESPEKAVLDEFADRVPEGKWGRYRMLEGAKGPLVCDFVAFRAVTALGKLPGPEGWVLIRRKVSGFGAEEAPKYKYYLSNAPLSTPLEELVRVCGMRWPIESAFEEAKGELGLDEYELRFYQGWHHHMTLVILAHHFLVRLQARLQARLAQRREERRGSEPSPREGAGEAAKRLAGGEPGGQAGQGGERARALAEGGGGAQPRRSAAALTGAPARAGVRSRGGAGAGEPPPAPQGRLLPLAS
jgi:SRSO17 transposase